MAQSVVTDLESRGLIYQKTPGIEKPLEKGTTIYWGIDPTGDSLHIGHLLGVVFLKRLYDAGHTIIALVGGGTAMIGDPGGKDAERPILPKEVIEANKEKIKKQLSRFFTFDDKRVRMVDNADWLEKLHLITFLREAGKYMSINSMLDKDSVKSRITREEGISYAEFSYQLLQSYDFEQLYNTYNCEIQIGGSDQWGNIVQGVELIRKKNARQAYALSYPLIVNPKTGKKFGKTESGEGIWLDSEKTHPFKLYQFFINTEDELAPTLMRYFSFKPFSEIEKMIEKWESAREMRSLQKELAFEIVSLIHGTEVATQCKKITAILFEKGAEEMSENDFAFIKTALPHSSVTGELDLVSALVETGIVASKGEARRLVDQKGASATLYFDKYYLVKKGKREYGVVEKV